MIEKRKFAKDILLLVTFILIPTLLGCSDSRYEAVHSYIELKDYSGALRILKNIEDDNPKDIKAQYLKLDSYTGLNDYNNALATIEKMNIIEPKNSRKHYFKFYTILLDKFYSTFDSVYSPLGVYGTNIADFLLKSSDNEIYEADFLLKNVDLMSYEYLEERLQHSLLSDTSALYKYYHSIIQYLNPVLYFDLLEKDECEAIKRYFSNIVFITKRSSQVPALSDGFIETYNSVSSNIILRLGNLECEDFSKRDVYDAMTCYLLKWRIQELPALLLNLPESIRMELVDTRRHMLQNYRRCKDSLEAAGLSFSELSNTLFENSSLHERLLIQLYEGTDCNGVSPNDYSAFILNNSLQSVVEFLETCIRECGMFPFATNLIKRYKDSPYENKKMLLEIYTQSPHEDICRMLRDEYSSNVWHKARRDNDYKNELLRALLRLKDKSFLKQLLNETARLATQGNYEMLWKIDNACRVQDIPDADLFDYMYGKCIQYNPTKAIQSSTESIFTKLLISYCDIASLSKMEAFYNSTTSKIFKHHTLFNIDLDEKPFMYLFYSREVPHALNDATVRTKKYYEAKINTFFRQSNTERYKRLLTNLNEYSGDILEEFLEYYGEPELFYEYYRQEYNGFFDNYTTLAFKNNFSDSKFIIKTNLQISKYCQHDMAYYLTTDDYDIEKDRDKYFRLLLLARNSIYAHRD